MGRVLFMPIVVLTHSSVTVFPQAVIIVCRRLCYCTLLNFFLSKQLNRYADEEINQTNKLTN